MKEHETKDKKGVPEKLNDFFVKIGINPLMLGGNKKVTHT